MPFFPWSPPAHRVVEEWGVFLFVFGRGMWDLSSCMPWAPDQGWNRCPLQWNGVLATGPPGKSQERVFILLLSKFLSHDFVASWERRNSCLSLTVHSPPSSFSQHYYCWLHPFHKCQLLKEGGMILLGLASLQLQKGPKTSVTSYKLLARITCLVQVCSESLLHVVTRDPVWWWFCFLNHVF